MKKLIITCLSQGRKGKRYFRLANLALFPGYLSQDLHRKINVSAVRFEGLLRPGPLFTHH